jgi:hypothetical protein
MGKFICNNLMCGKEFKSNRSTAKFCSKKCSNQVTYENRDKTKFHQSDKKYSDAEMIGRLIQFASDSGKVPSCRTIFDPCCDTYRVRFGSWNNALIAAGLKPHPSCNQRNIPLDGKALRDTDSKRVPLRPGLRFDVLQRDGFRCVYCGGTPSQGCTLQVDHVIPVSSGGKTVIENLVTACWTCNIGKCSKNL